MPVPRAEIANSCPDSLPATLRCPAARHGPTSCSRVASGVAACCSVHDALRLPRVVSLARFARLAPVLRLAKMRPALLHRAAASNDARAACPVRKHCMFPRLSAGNTALPCHPPWPHVFLARRQRRRRARDALSLPIAVPHRAVRAHLAPAVRLATMRPALLRRAASSNDASAVYPVRKTLSRFAARRAESRAPRSGHAA